MQVEFIQLWNLEKYYAVLVKNKCFAMDGDVSTHFKVVNGGIVEDSSSTPPDHLI
jgi:hypothetical protein